MLRTSIGCVVTLCDESASGQSSTCVRSASGTEPELYTRHLSPLHPHPSSHSVSSQWLNACCLQRHDNLQAREECSFRGFALQWLRATWVACSPEHWDSIKLEVARCGQCPGVDVNASQRLIRLWRALIKRNVCLFQRTNRRGLANRPDEVPFHDASVFCESEHGRFSTGTGYL
ncbi:hypothetical protein FKP32DRAFT_1009088 [Trametes sanguinea]|nr:hypothetical protein FKP32DRAFT_1009088 [Trametes sanguinea]